MKEGKELVEYLGCYNRYAEPITSMAIAKAIAYSCELCCFPTDEEAKTFFKRASLPSMTVLDNLMCYIPVDYKNICELAECFYLTRLRSAYPMQASAYPFYLDILTNDKLTTTTRYLPEKMEELYKTRFSDFNFIYTHYLCYAQVVLGGKGE